MTQKLTNKVEADIIEEIQPGIEQKLETQILEELRKAIEGSE